MKGHKKDVCYKLNKYPPDFEFTRIKNTQPSSANTIVTPSSPSKANTEANSSSSTPLFSKDQYEEIIKLLKKEIAIEAKVNLPSTVTLLSNLNYQGEWVLDTEATNHITPHLPFLSDVNECSKKSTFQISNDFFSKILMWDCTPWLLDRSYGTCSMCLISSTIIFFILWCFRPSRMERLWGLVEKTHDCIC